MMHPPSHSAEHGDGSCASCSNTSPAASSKKTGSFLSVTTCMQLGRATQHKQAWQQRAKGLPGRGARTCCLLPRVPVRMHGPSRLAPVAQPQTLPFGTPLGAHCALATPATWCANYRPVPNHVQPATAGACSTKLLAAAETAKHSLSCTWQTLQRRRLCKDKDNRAQQQQDNCSNSAE